MAVRFEDNSEKILRQIAENKKRVLTAVGIEAVALIQDQMLNGYPKPVYDTGMLLGSISYAPPDENSVQVGTNVEYGKYVHEGTYKMQGRPFIRDALIKNKSRLQTIVEEEMKKGF